MQWLTRSYALARTQVLVRAAVRVVASLATGLIALMLLAHPLANAAESATAINSASSACSSSNSSCSSNSGSSVASVSASANANPVASHPPAIPFKHDTGVASSSLGGGAVGVLLISAVTIVGVMWARKKLNLVNPQHAQGTLLRILESQRLGPRAVLSVVEFDGGRYLIAQSEHGLQCLAGPNGQSPTLARQEQS
ncbi:MAG: FliO/MopB family protein [Burkholderiales bacterium]|nr:FliO/MopB family protein [Burkholderiales bacterium]